MLLKKLTPQEAKTCLKSYVAKIFNSKLTITLYSYRSMRKHNYTKKLILFFHIAFIKLSFNLGLANKNRLRKHFIYTISFILNYNKYYINFV